MASNHWGLGMPQVNTRQGLFLAGKEKQKHRKIRVSFSVCSTAMLVLMWLCQYPSFSNTLCFQKCSCCCFSYKLRRKEWRGVIPTSNTSHTVWIVYSGPFSIEPLVWLLLSLQLRCHFFHSVSSGLLTSQSPLFLYIKFCINAGGDEEREEENEEVAA